eukprot:361838-Chlamydomonas_euryale.AAC.1
MPATDLSSAPPPSPPPMDKAPRGQCPYPSPARSLNAANLPHIHPVFTRLSALSLQAGDRLSPPDNNKTSITKTTNHRCRPCAHAPGRTMRAKTSFCMHARCGWVIRMVAQYGRVSRFWRTYGTLYGT